MGGFVCGRVPPAPVRLYRADRTVRRRLGLASQGVSGGPRVSWERALIYLRLGFNHRDKSRRESGVLLAIKNFLWAPHPLTGATHRHHITSWRCQACLSRHCTPYQGPRPKAASPNKRASRLITTGARRLIRPREPPPQARGYPCPAFKRPALLGQPGLSSARNEQHRMGSGPRHRLRHAPQNHVLDPAAAMGADHHQIRPPARRLFHDNHADMLV